jgi:hypothetical protein
MVVAEQSALPPIVLHQQRAIDAALELADGWDAEATRLHRIADYTRVHGAPQVADRYALRGRALADNAVALRGALSLEEAQG